MSTRVSEVDVANAINAVGGSSIPLAFYLGVAKHESGFCIDCPPSDNGQSWGIFQVNKGEQSESGVQGSLTDLGVNTGVFVYLCERNRTAIRNLVGLSPSDPDPWDMGAYLALAHNQGLNAALTTLKTYATGDPTYLGWNEYKTRNWSGVCQRSGAGGQGICAYGDDCLYDPTSGAPETPRQPELGFAVATVAAGLIFFGVSQVY
jgi:hypothetical protein